MTGNPVEDEAKRGLHGFVLTATVLLMTFVMAWLAESDVAGMRGRLEGYLTLWPQHWRFFVDLDRDLVVGYRATPGSPRLSPLTERQEWGSWSWGLSRKGYAESVELREVARRIPDRYWHSCAEPGPADCGVVREAAEPYRTRNRRQEPVLCGPAAITIERLPPLEPRQVPAQPRQVYRIAFVELECGK